MIRYGGVAINWYKDYIKKVTVSWRKDELSFWIHLIWSGYGPSSGKLGILKFMGKVGVGERDVSYQHLAEKENLGSEYDSQMI